ncbi:hypothetical protein JCM33374_g5358 [Metschnikowia sp. JCM 33374]|nr:hypothetical protein JCM33374_g5358 [Metschnikowia sp. JCM 33374]
MPEWVSTFPGYSDLMRKVKRAIGAVCKTGPIPRHVGVIMDGNRRYAKNHKIEMKEGHNLGFDSMASILELLYESGVACATVYAFSIENFKRSRYEVEWLMDLAKSKLYQMSQHGELCEQYGIRIKILGNVALLPSDVQKILQETQDMTAHNTRAVLNVCFPYTSRDEIAHSVQGVVKASMDEPEMIIDEHAMERFLYTADAPPLDLLIRTSGTSRLSDFLLWQCVPSTCAIVFSDRLWPEFSPWDMTKILLSWSFNTYWYGHGNGQTMSRIVLRDSKSTSSHRETSISIDSDTSTAYERYATESPTHLREGLNSKPDKV